VKRRPRMEVGQENSRAVPPILSEPVVEAVAASVQYEVAGDGHLRSRPVGSSGVSREVCP